MSWEFLEFFPLYEDSLFSRRPTKKVLYMAVDGQDNADDPIVQTKCAFLYI